MTPIPKTNQLYGRRDALRFFGAAVGSSFLGACTGSRVMRGLESLVGDSKLTDSKPTLDIQVDDGLREHEDCIVHEISAFLRYPAVKKVLSFDPYSPPKPLTIHIYQGSPLEREFASSLGPIMDINGVLFALPPVSLSEAYHYVKQKLGKNKIESSGDFAARVAATAEERYEQNRMLLNDPALAWMFRNMLVVHELSHQPMYFADGRPAASHGVTTRPEVRVATELYHDQTITRELWLKTLGFYSKFENIDHEPEQNIQEYIGKATLLASR
ncbi:hypothetical protein HYS47_04805 [Candidatus Woesearchaeota archaeon]|nr:hypothetical protein [Candidatus Woesearchaeota archaeon]